jgi:hypothetical protein
MNRFRLAMDHGGLMAPRWSWTSRPIARSRDGNFPLLNARVGSNAAGTVMPDGAVCALLIR